MSLIFNFVENHDQNQYNYQLIQTELNERLKEFSEQIKETGVYLQNPIQTLSQYVIEEVVVGTNSIAFRLQDGRVCRVSYAVKTEKPPTKAEKIQRRLNKLVNYGNNSSRSANNGSNQNDTQPKSYTRSVDPAYISQTSTSNRSSIPHRLARYQMLSNHTSTPRVNFIREMQRQGIYLARTFSAPIAASEVPEDLIEQCQTVLQGKSRQLIIRELQRTNLDVNMAVNNLLSRDDEADENGGSTNIPEDWEETEDLLSLLDQTDNPLFEAAIAENSLGIPEDIFPNVRLRQTTMYPMSTGELESYADRRKRRRIDCQLRLSGESISQSFYNPVYDDSATITSDDSNSKTESGSSSKKNCIVFGNCLEFWKEPCQTNVPNNKRKEMRFIKIGGMYSELVGITEDNELHQWRWTDQDPWNSCESVTADPYWATGNKQPVSCYYHPRLPSLNLFGEKIVRLSTSNTRATVLTGSGKLASWIDEMIAPIFQVLRPSTNDSMNTMQYLKIEHAAQQFQEIKNETITDLLTSPLVSAVKCSSGNIYWWGVVPFKYRKNAIEKNRDRPTNLNTDEKIHDSSRRSHKSLITEPPHIVVGTFVSMRNSPIFHAGAIAFTVVGGVPKIGTLLEDAWKVEDTCRFSVKPVQSLVNERRHNTHAMNSLSFDPISHETLCPHLNASFLYGLLGRTGVPPSTSSNKLVTVSTSDSDTIGGHGSLSNHGTHKSSTAWAEMPPPPSPASSTCSDQSGPVKISPGTFKRKKQSLSSSNMPGDLINEVNTESRPSMGSSNSSSQHRAHKSSSVYVATYDYEPIAGHKRSLTPDETTKHQSNHASSSTSHIHHSQQTEEEEDWCLKDVVFLEDGRTQPVGVVLKVDGSIAAVKFLKDSERACVAVNCPFSPLATVFGSSVNNSSSSSNTSLNNTNNNNNPPTEQVQASPNNSDPYSWFNDCRLLRKDELVIVKQPLMPKVPDIVQKVPKCLPIELTVEPNETHTTPNIVGMALENELIHLLLRKSSNLIEYKTLSLTKKVISANKFSTSASGFFNNANNAVQLSSILSPSLDSDYCELKSGNIFNAERHKPLLIRDGNGTVYPVIFNDNHTSGGIYEQIPSPHWIDLPPIRCADFNLITHTKISSMPPSSSTSTNLTLDSKQGKAPMKTTQFLIGVIIVESQSLMTNIMRAEDKRINTILDNMTSLTNTDGNFLDKVILEKLDGHRNILHVAISMCEAVSNQEVHWKLGNLLSYRSKSKKNNATAEDLSSSSSSRINHSSPDNGNNPATISYRRWRESTEAIRQIQIDAPSLYSSYSRGSTYPNTNSVRFTVLSSSQTPLQTNTTNLSSNATNNNNNNNNSNNCNNSNNWLLPPNRREQKDKRSTSYRIINLLINHVNMEKYLVELLSQKNSDGLTPFMQAITQRLYHIAQFILDCVLDICDIQYVSVKTPNEMALRMLYPGALSIPSNISGVTSTNLSESAINNSLTKQAFDDNPLQILCHNDGCSFVWTGPEHIRQDIFECKTCGLTESLCCCTECARICHAGHDCHLKKTSPTAYCDCWEKCKCRTLILGDHSSRLELLKRLLHCTDFVTMENRDKEHILVYLIKTAERQLREHKQMRSSSRRPSTSTADAGLTARSKLQSSQTLDPQMPEHGLESNGTLFALAALDMLLGNWSAVETVFRMGDRSDFLRTVLKTVSDHEKLSTNDGICPYTDDDIYLNYQSSSEQLDQFIFTLITKTPSTTIDALLNTINKQMHICDDNSTTHSKTLVRNVARRFIRSVTRVYITLQLQMAPDYNSRKRTPTAASRLGTSFHVYSNTQTRPIEICKKIFENLLTVSLIEIPRMAADIITPIQTGLVKPTSNYNPVYQITDAIKNLDQVFQSNPIGTGEKPHDQTRTNDGKQMRNNIANDHNYQSNSTPSIRRQLVTNNNSFTLNNSTSGNNLSGSNNTTSYARRTGSTLSTINDRSSTNNNLLSGNTNLSSIHDDNGDTNTSNSRNRRMSVVQSTSADDDEDDDDDDEDDDDDDMAGGATGTGGATELSSRQRRTSSSNQHSRVRRISLEFHGEGGDDDNDDDDGDDEPMSNTSVGIVGNSRREVSGNSGNVGDSDWNSSSQRENVGSSVVGSGDPRSNMDQDVGSNNVSGETEIETSSSSRRRLQNITGATLRRQSRLNTLFLEESDGDGNTIGENDLEAENDMDVYDEDHDDTDIVPETESDSDDSITSSICVTIERMETESSGVGDGTLPATTMTTASDTLGLSSISTSRSEMLEHHQQSLRRAPLAEDETISSINKPDERMRNTESPILEDSRRRSNRNLPGILEATIEHEVHPDHIEEAVNMKSVNDNQHDSFNDNYGDDSSMDERMIHRDPHIRIARLEDMRVLSGNSGTQSNSNNNQGTLATSAITATTITPSSSNSEPNRLLGENDTTTNRNVDLDAVSEDESEDEDDEEDDSSQNTEDEEPLSTSAVQQTNNTNSQHLDNSINSNLSNTITSESRSTYKTNTGTTNPGGQFGIQTTQIQLSRAFSYLIKLIAQLLIQLQQRNLTRLSNAQQNDDMKSDQTDHIIFEISQSLGPVWIWICRSMDYLESQVCFSFAYQRKHKLFQSRPVLRFDLALPNESNLPTGVSSGTSHTQATPITSAGNTSTGGILTNSSSFIGSNQTANDNWARHDFLKYLVSMMRSSSDEHGDQIPMSLYAVDYCHLAYLVDSMLYLMKTCFMNGNALPINSSMNSSNIFNRSSTQELHQFLKKEPTLLGEDYQEVPDMDEEPGSNGKPETHEDVFFSRSDHPLGWLGLGANSFRTPVADSLPLAHMPQLLQPPGPTDEVFGVLRRFDSSSHLHQMDSSETDETEQDVQGRHFQGSLPLHMGVSSRWADNRLILSGIPVGDLRTRWRYSLEVLANSFEQNVATEPNSVLAEFSHFSIKETRFRKEIERIRNQCRRDLSLVVSRDRESILCGTMTQLAQEYGKRGPTVTLTNSSSNLGGMPPSSSSQTNGNNLPPLLCHRFKVKFTDEPGEGNGVARSFLTVFAEHALSDEPLSNSILSSAAAVPNPNSSLSQSNNTNSIARKLSRKLMDNYSSSRTNEHNYIRRTTTSSPVTSATPTVNSRLVSTSSVLLSLSSGSRSSNSNVQRELPASQTTLLDPPTSAFAVFTSSSAPYYSLTPIVSTSRRSTLISRPPPTTIQQHRILPAPPAYSEVVPSSTSSQLDTANLSANFTASLGNTSPIWIGNNWLSSTTTTLPSSTTNSTTQSNIIATQRRIIRQSKQQTLQQLSILDFLRTWFKIDDTLLQQIALSIINLIGGQRNDVLALVEKLANEHIRTSDIINCIIDHYTRNFQGNTSRSSISNTLLSAGSNALDALDILNSEAPKSPPLNSSTNPEMNLELSLVSFNIHLDSLIKSFNQDRLSDPLGSNTQTNTNNPSINNTTTQNTTNPESAPLFWQPGHTDFYAPRRTNALSSDDVQLISPRTPLYRCVGRVIGIALLMNETLPLKLSRHILKYILGWPIAWHDFAFYNCQLYESLRHLMQTAMEYNNRTNHNDEDDPLLDYHLTFSLTPREEEGGNPGVTTIPLIPGGEDISVNSKNVFQYVKRYCLMRMVGLVKVQLDQLRAGVYDVLPRSALTGLSPEDLRLLLNGTDEINVDILLSYTSFLDESQGASSSSSVEASLERVNRFKKWFSQVIRAFDSIQRQNLLYFWTSSPALPASNQGFQPTPTITIRPADDIHLPTANTCISRLYIPLYSSRQILRDKLLQAIETKCFGFV